MFKLHYRMHSQANNKPTLPLASQRPLSQHLAVPCPPGKSYRKHKYLQLNRTYHK